MRTLRPNPSRHLAPSATLTTCAISTISALLRPAFSIALTAALSIAFSITPLAAQHADPPPSTPHPVLHPPRDGFSMLNGRNHPRMDWQSARTEHFEIVYPRHLEGIQHPAATIAEATYQALSTTLGVTPERRIRIYLGDPDEIVNGYAVPIPDAYTAIWVGLNDVAEAWSGPEKWLRTVIAHELAHIFHYEAVRPDLPLLGILGIAGSLPAPWTEGLAQYLTEPWHVYRGDALLRTAVYDGRLSYTDGASLRNGGLMYASGNAQLRYFASTYGDSLLPALFAHREDKLGGLFKIHDFEAGFKDVTGTSFDAFTDDWRRHMAIYYHTLASGMQRLDSLGMPPDTLGGPYVQSVLDSPDGRLTAVVSIVSNDQPFQRLAVYAKHEVRPAVSDSARTTPSPDAERSTDRYAQSTAEHPAKSTTKRKIDPPATRYQARATLAEGSFNPVLAWSPDSRHLYWSATGRARDGSLVHDLYRAELHPRTRILRSPPLFGKADTLTRILVGRTEALTRGRRAVHPQATPDGDGLYFVANDRGTGNIHHLDLATRAERPVTNHQGDVQIGRIALHPAGTHLAYARFDADGGRTLVVRDLREPQAPQDLQDLLAPGDPLSQLSERTLTDPAVDDRDPVWSPDGARLAFTSMRDGVPNAWLIDPFTPGAAPERITAQFTGASLQQWVEPGELLLLASDSKSRDRIHRVPADRRAPEPHAQAPEAYTRWTRHSPVRVIPSSLPVDSTLAQPNGRYRPLANLSHLATLPFPYASDGEDVGIGVLTAFMEPLNLHAFQFLGGLSATRPERGSFALASYTWNGWKPSISLNLYHNSFTSRFYDDQVLLTTATGGFLLASLPLDLNPDPFRQTWLYARLRHETVRAEDTFTGADSWNEALGYSALTGPQDGLQSDLRFGLRMGRQTPYRYQGVHPLSGWGLEPRLTLAGRAFGGDTRFVRGDLTAFAILPGGGDNRFYLYARAIAQSGTAFSQDYIGFSRYDELRFGGSPPGFDVLYTDTERVRGHRDVTAGDRMLFGTLEYRIPLTKSLDTRILGLVELGATTLAAFLDAGAVWGGYEPMIIGWCATPPVVYSQGPPLPVRKRAGAGLELKNQLLLGGLPLTHSLGFAQPVQDLGTERRQEWYYRVRVAIPF